MSQGKDLRLAALWRFATAITLFNLAGHLWLGFEQSWAYPFAALATGYSLELLLEFFDARAQARKPRFLTGGKIKPLLEFLLPAHITSMAVSMLLYSNARLTPIVYATTVAIASKYLFRVSVGGRLRHFLNPSNFGISATLLTFPWIGIAPPYMFTENLGSVGDVVLPILLVCSGSFLNTRFTRRLPLIFAWLGTFALQAFLRSSLAGTPMPAAFMPMSGLAFLLFTFYMVSDPSTTPHRFWGQVLFGAGVAVTYGLLLANHVVFTLFFSLSIVCVCRGIGLWAGERWPRRASVPLPPATAAVPAALSTPS